MKRLEKRMHAFSLKGYVLKTSLFIDHPFPILCSKNKERSLQTSTPHYCTTTSTIDSFIKCTALGSTAETTTSVGTASGGTATRRRGLVSATRCGRRSLTIAARSSGSPALAGGGSGRSRVRGRCGTGGSTHVRGNVAGTLGKSGLRGLDALVGLGCGRARGLRGGRGGCR